MAKVLFLYNSLFPVFCNENSVLKALCKTKHKILRRP